MIRKILFLLVLFSGFFACKEDEELRFDVPVEFRKVHFSPVAGGAVMRYYVDNPDVYGVRVCYNDAWGELRTREGSYLGDSLMLTGFTEARQNVPARVSFFNRGMVESEAIEMTFNTENSATIALFDSLKVQEFWGGFSIGYTAPELVSGMVHIFYLGTNPMTGQPDSILVSSTPIKGGGDTLNFQMTQVMETTDVVVRTDEFEGKRVKLQVYKDMPCLSMDTLKFAEGDFKFEFTGTTTTNPTYGIGEEFLFDGDKQGIGYRRNRAAGDVYKYNTYMVGPNAFYSEDEKQKNRFIIDLGEEKVPAAVSLYAFLNYQTNWPAEGMSVTWSEFLMEIWSGVYYTRLPAKAKLYGTNADPKTVDLSTCSLLYTLDDDPDNVWDSWATRTDSRGSMGTAGWKEDWSQGDEKDVMAAEPVILKMLCNYTGAKYRYLIFVVTDTYNYKNKFNKVGNKSREYVTFNEMEVCVKAE